MTWVQNFSKKKYRIHLKILGARKADMKQVPYWEVHKHYALAFKI